VQHYNGIQATSPERQAMATAEQISDPILGDKGGIYKAGNATWAGFKKHFGPTKLNVLVLTMVDNGMVPQAQRALYQELEDWYARSSSKVLLKILGAMQWSTTANLTRLTHKIEDHLQLELIDLRVGDHSTSQCVLRYKTDLDYCDWYARISKNYRIACAPWD
jgi:hypothetical protein